MITLINHQGLKVVKGIQIQTPSPSIGLAYVGGYLKSKGVAYTAIDACGEAMDQITPDASSPDVWIQGLTVSEVLERIPAATRIIGMTCLFSQSWKLVYELAAEIRKAFPNVLLVAGGEHPTALAKDVLQPGIFNVVVVGEGEETFYELAFRIQRGEDWSQIAGIIYYDRAAGTLVRNLARARITAIDDFPYPDWDSWSIEQYIDLKQVTGINLGRSMPILGSRGCPFVCTFCSNEFMWTPRYIMRSGKSIVDEMEYMKKKYRVDGFAFMDLTFVVNRKKVMEFARELIDRNLNIKYQIPAGTRCEAFDEDLAFALEKSGLKNFAFAPESGSPEILKVIKKKIDVARFLEAVRDVLKTKMTVAVFFVIGFPADTPRTLKQSLRLIRKLAMMGVHDITVSKFTPYPGSADFEELARVGKVSADFQSNLTMINFFDYEGKSYCDAFTGKQLSRWMTWSFLNFYVISVVVRPWRVVENLWDYFSGGIENTRYMRAFAEIFYLRRKWTSWKTRTEKAKTI